MFASNEFIKTEIFSSSLVTDSEENIGGDLSEQLSDLLLLPYFVSGYFISLEGLLGHGLGSSQLVLRALAQDFFGFTNPDVETPAKED